MLLDGNRSKIVAILALCLCLLSGFQKAVCTGDYAPEANNLLIDFSSDLEASGPAANDPVIAEAAANDPVIEESIEIRIYNKFRRRMAKAHNGRCVLYLSLWEFLSLPDDEIAEIRVDNMMLRELSIMDFFIVDQKMVARISKKGKDCDNKKKKTKETCIVRNLGKKNSHVKEIFLVNLPYKPNPQKEIVFHLFRKKLEMERVIMLLSLLHHYFDSLQVVYLSMYQITSNEVERNFREHNIYLKGGMPSLVSVVLGHPEKKIHGYICNSYELDPLVIDTRSIWMNDEDTIYREESGDCSVSFEPQNNLSYLVPSGKTLAYKLDNTVCDLCKLPFKKEKTEKYSKRIFVTKCQKLFHHKCIKKELKDNGTGCRYLRRVNCSEKCDNIIRTRKMYYKVIWNKKANGITEYNLVLMKFSSNAILRNVVTPSIQEQEVKYDERPAYTIPIFLGPLESSSAPSQPPAVGSLLD